MNAQEALIAAWSDHSRIWKGYKFVYPVISRRAGGLSLGVNLNPDHKCSFACVYCQSGTQEGYLKIPIDLQAIEHELRAFLEFYLAGGLQKSKFFEGVPNSALELKDICISGDGEATLVREFPEVCNIMAALQKEYATQDLNFKLRLITNATRLKSSSVEAGVRSLLQSDGEIWAKLDAGSGSWYKRINRSSIDLAIILENLQYALEHYPLCIQTMLCKIEGKAPDTLELAHYVENILKIAERAPQNLTEIQLYTIIRKTMTNAIQAVSKSALENAGEFIRENLLQAGITPKIRIFSL